MPARANPDVWLAFGADYRMEAGVPPLTPEQVAYVMAFLASPAASGVSGTSLLIYSGHIGSGITGLFDAPMIKILAVVS